MVQTVSKDSLTKHQALSLLRSQLRDEMDSFENTFKDLGENILPRRTRFEVENNNKGGRKDDEIIDSSATLSSRTLASGMMTGVTSPARAWFKTKTDIEDLNESQVVKEYFTTVDKRMRSAMLRTNLYNQLPVLYGDLGTFATGAIFMEEDFEDVANFKCFPIGSYMIANDRRSRVKVFFREFQMSVRQIVDKFGRLDKEDRSKIFWDNLSDTVKDQWDSGQTEQMVDVEHFVMPNTDYNPKRLQSKYKKFSSTYRERGMASTSGSIESSSSYTDKFLSERGYDYFPVMAVRWEVVGEDTYGTGSPGFSALGDVKQLQLMQKRKLQAIDQKVNPAMVGPTSLRNAGASQIPGDITFVDDRDGTKGIKRLFEVDFDIRELNEELRDLRQRISKAYYEDLFLMLANSDRRQITATEVAERQEEKLLALGPVLERINQDLLDPLIENFFYLMEKQGLLPEAPEELIDADYSVEYISVMAQAQKLAGIGNIERFLGFSGQIAQFDPSVIQKLNMDKIVEDYADKVGIDPSLLKTEEEMEAIRAEQQAQAQAEQEAEQAGQMVQAGKALSETKMDEDTALQEVLGGAMGE